MYYFTLAFVDRKEPDTLTVDYNLALFAKIDGNAATDVGLHLTKAPFRLVRVPDQLTRFQ